MSHTIIPTGPTTDLEFDSALRHGFDKLAAAFTASFEAYAVAMKFDAAALEWRARAETWDLGSSFLAWRGTELAGSLFISRRGRSARVAAMGVTVPHRRTGVGRAMMERALTDSHARGDVRFVLEVLVSNAAAVALYESTGMKRVRRLVGFECPELAAAEEAAPDFAEIELADFAARAYAANTGGEPQLPWQIDAPTLANLSPPARAFALGDRAAAIVVDPGPPGRVSLRALLVPPHLRRRGHASALLAQLSRQFPERPWVSSFAIPEGLADAFFLARGFKPETHPQWEMVRA